MDNSRMNQPPIFDYIFSRLENKHVVTINEIKRLLGESEFLDFKTFTRIFSKTMFKVFHDDLPEDKIKEVYLLRRELYIDEPTDDDEYKELIIYFESIEDYETCDKINKAKYEYN